jgi:hypothetical protein
MSIYRKVWQDYHNQSIPKGWHIHHIDGNHENNHPDNLMCVSPFVHWCIHFLQGDPVALDGKFVQGASEAGKLGGHARKNTHNPKIHLATKAAHSPEAKAKRSASLKARKLTEDHKSKIGKSNKNNPKLKEYKSKPILFENVRYNSIKECIKHRKLGYYTIMKTARYL